MKNINKENIQVAYSTLNKTSFTYSVMKSAEETLKGQPREVEAELGKALDTLLDDRVREWIELNEPISIKDSAKGKPRFTNKLLLDTCKESYQLFEIDSEADYRLMQEIMNAFGDVETDEKVYKINEVFSITTIGDDFTIMSSDGTLEKIPKASFKNHPRAIFNNLKSLILKAKETV